MSDWVSYLGPYLYIVVPQVCTGVPGHFGRERFVSGGVAFIISDNNGEVCAASWQTSRFHPSRLNLGGSVICGALALAAF